MTIAAERSIPLRSRRPVHHEGKHLLRFGVDASRYQLNRFNNFAQRGSVTFNNNTGRGCVTGFANPPALSGFQNFYWAT